MQRDRLARQVTDLRERASHEFRDGQMCGRAVPTFRHAAGRPGIDQPGDAHRDRSERTRASPDALTP
jgi:hypothetical protein